MQSQVSAEIDELINKIYAISDVDQIFLFGSYAYGLPTAESDIDLCVITNNDTIRKRELLRTVRKSISGVATFPVDLLLYNKEEFYDRVNLNATMEHKIATEGVFLYGKQRYSK
jgi:predicted nucleotidyltransferase